MDTKSDDPSTSRELLEVPDHPSLAIQRNLVVDKPPKPRISRPAANTDLLGRLQTFLPQLHKANQELDTTSHSEFEKEVVIVGNTPSHGMVEQKYTSDNEPIVELDLACGLFDLKDDAAVAAAEKALINDNAATNPSSDDDTDPSDTESDSSEEDNDGDEKKSGEIENDDGEQQKQAAASTKSKKKRDSGRSRQQHPGIEEIS